MNRSKSEGSSVAFLAPVSSIKEAHLPRNPSMVWGNNWTKRNTTIKAPMKHKPLILSHFRNVCLSILLTLAKLLLMFLWGIPKPIAYTHILQIDAKLSTPSVSPPAYSQTQTPSTQTAVLAAPFEKAQFPLAAACLPRHGHMDEQRPLPSSRGKGLVLPGWCRGGEVVALRSQLQL